MLISDLSSKQFHQVLSSGILLVSLLFLLGFLCSVYYGVSVVLSLDVFCGNLYLHTLTVTLSTVSLMFSSLVSFITCVVFLYSYFYIGFYYNYNFFLFTTLGFVISILIVINFTDLFIVMLGWDGLGVISFFLIVYYNSSNSVYSGLFTILINRIGDALLLIAISLFMITSDISTSFFAYSSLGNTYVIIILVLGLITKSALFPFSPWLPAAISAPTPISSLVHSSTLVTAGLYLIIRYSSLLYSSSFYMLLLLVFSVFTTFYAGANSVVETDLNKLIALSTLSHLGFIGLAISSGLEVLAVFHLFTHAMFKSLVFIAVGEVISAQSHYQDIRFLSSGLLLTPISSCYIFVSSISLFGLPFVSGFYSNDIILEFMSSSSWIGNLLVVVVYVNLIFTYVYTSRLIGFCVGSLKHSSYFCFIETPSHLFHLSVLALIGLLFGYLYTRILLETAPAAVVPVLRFLPTFILISTIVLYIININSSFIFSSIFSASLGSMLFLTPINSNFMSLNAFTFMRSFTNTVEHGLLPHLTISFPLVSVFSTSRLIWYFFKSPLYLVIWCLLFMILVVNLFF